MSHDDAEDRVTADRHVIERPGEDSGVMAEVWIDGARGAFCLSLQDVLERPEGARGPAALEVEFAVSVPVPTVASSLDCAEDAVLDVVVESWAGRGGELLSWARELPGAKRWSRVDPL